MKRYRDENISPMAGTPDEVRAWNAWRRAKLNDQRRTTAHRSELDYVARVYVVKPRQVGK